MLDFEAAMRGMPLVAVLRGIRPEEALPIGQALVDAGFTIMEVTLNSPDPYVSIRLLAERFGDRALVGAGTVTAVPEVKSVKEAGGRLVVMPHCDTEVVRASKVEGLAAAPGVATPTEAFAALAAGADALKLFPAEMIPPKAIGAMRAVLPKETRVLPVGSITPEIMPAYHAVGANGFGLGSALYKAGRPVQDVAARARDFIAAWRALAQAS